MTRCASLEERPSTLARRPAGRAMLGLAMLGLAAAACTPTVRVEAPKDPITINLNVKADVVVTLKETAREDIQANPDVF